MADEFVGYGQGVDDQAAQGGAGGCADLGQMSERVQAMAQTLYEQLELLGTKRINIFFYFDLVEKLLKPPVNVKTIHFKK